MSKQIQQQKRVKVIRITPKEQNPKEENLEILWRNVNKQQSVKYNIYSSTFIKNRQAQCQQLINMRTYIILGLLLTLASALSTYFSPIYAHTFSQDIDSIISLGYLQSGDHIKLIFEFPNPTGVQPQQFRLFLYNSDQQIGVLNPPALLSFYTIPTSSDTLPPMQGTVDTTGTHKLHISPISSVDSIQIMQIKIYVNLHPSPTKKIVVMPRTTPYKLIYIQSSTFVTISKSPGPLKVYKMDPNNRLKQQSLRYSGVTTTKILYLTPGYYSIQPTITPLNSKSHLFQYQSDPYPCPYSPQYTDVHKIFQPCFHGQVSCPPNEMLVGGVCVCKIHRVRINGQCVCKPGLSDVNGICVCPNGSPPDLNGNCNQCPFGQTMGPNGFCVCINTGLLPNADGTCNCPPGQTPSGFNGVCVCISTGQPPDSMGNCNDCPPGMIMNSFGQCVCPLGQINIGGQCVPNIIGNNNNGNEIINNGNSICPFSFIEVNGQCICPPGMQEIQGMCLPS